MRVGLGKSWKWLNSRSEYFLGFVTENQPIPKSATPGRLILRAKSGEVALACRRRRELIGNRYGSEQYTGPRREGYYNVLTGIAR
jgi:hypothetical protein